MSEDTDAAKDAEKMEKIVSLCKRRGYIFQSAEIYGGLNGCWDYGPLGAELKRNLKDYWWRKNVQERDDIVGMDGIRFSPTRKCSLPPATSAASPTPWWTARTCKARFRADQLGRWHGMQRRSLPAPPEAEQAASSPSRATST